MKIIFLAIISFQFCVFPIYSQSEFEPTPPPSPNPDYDYTDPRQIQGRLNEIAQQLKQIKIDEEVAKNSAKDTLRATVSLANLAEKGKSLAIEANNALLSCKKLKKHWIKSKFKLPGQHSSIRLNEKKFNECISKASQAINSGIKVSKLVSDWTLKVKIAENKSDLLDAVVEANKLLEIVLREEEQVLELIQAEEEIFNSITVD